MKNKLLPPNVINYDSRITPAEQNRIKLRLKAVGGVAITQIGYKVLRDAARSNHNKSRELNNSGVWRPEMSFALPSTASQVFLYHLSTLITDETLAQLPTVSEDKIADMLLSNPMIIDVPPGMLTSLTEVAVQRNIGPDTLAHAVAESAYPDQEAILESFGIYSYGQLRLVRNNG